MLSPIARQSKAGANAIGYSGERLVNYILRPSDGTSQAVCMGRSGLVDVTGAIGVVRDIGDLRGFLYAAAGGHLWKITGATPTKIGKIPDGPTQIASGINSLALVVDGRYFVCNGPSVAEVTPGAISHAVGVAYMDGYFCIVGTSGIRRDAMQISALDDAYTFDSTDIVFAESNADPLVGIVRENRELWLMGEKTTEMFYNSGSAGFPFTRAAIIEDGCIDGRTIAKTDNSVFWVRDDRAAVRSNGGSTVVISTQEVQDVFEASEVTCGFTIADRGTELYVVCVSGKPSQVYDLRTGLWSEFSTGLGESPWIASCAYRSGKAQYVGTTTGRVMRLDADTYTDDGEVIEGVATSVPISGGGERFKINRINLSIRGGDGGLGRAPRVMLQTSSDGKTWSGEKWRDLGDLGDHYKRAEWHGLGQFRRFQMRTRITDPVPRDIYGATYG